MDGLTNNLRQLRLNRNLTLNGLAVRARVDRGLLHFIERYGHAPRPETREKIAAALGVSLVDIWPNQHQE